ncbi:unnamed protein product, partial [Aureobasidium vineae]
RLAEVEAEKELLRSQLSSARKRSNQGDLQRQKPDIHNSSKAGSPSATLSKVTGWLDSSTRQSSHSPLLDIFTQYDRHHLVFDNIYQRLDIEDVVAIRSKADNLIRYIGADKSYRFEQSYGWSDDDQHRTLTKVLIFRRIVPPGSPQIRFHLTRTSPLHSILTDCAFSTAHVNVITWNKAYCMFPNVTFMDRRMYFLHHPDEAMGQVLSKYSAHGWRTSNWVDYDQTRGCNKLGIREKFRRVGDSSTWVIPLNLYKIRRPECPDSMIESCSFHIFPDFGTQESQHAVTGLKTFSIGAQTFSCCMLKHIYTFHAPDVSWIVFLREKLSRMIMLEILKAGDTGLIAKTRQPDFMSVDHKCCPLLKFRPRFQRPDGWESVDYMVPVWFEEWTTARRNQAGSIDLTPHPLNVARSKKQLGESQRNIVDSLPPPIPPRARSMTTSRLPSNVIPAPPLSSECEQFPLSLRTTTARLPRSISVSQMNQSNGIQPKLPTLVSPTRRIVSAQSQQSEPGCSLPRDPSESFSLSGRHPAQTSTSRHEQSQKPQLARSATSPHPISPQDITPPRSPEKQKADYFSLIHRRPKAPVPPPLDLSPTKIGSLIPDLPTPPPDLPLPAVPVRHRPKRSPLNFPSHLPWSPFEKKFRSVRSNNSLSSVSAGSEKIVAGEMNWL